MRKDVINLMYRMRYSSVNMHSKLEVHQQAQGTQYGLKSIQNGTIRTVNTVPQRPYRATLHQTCLGADDTSVLTR